MPHRLMRFARELRRSSTDAERLFWSRVRRGGVAQFKWKRQQPLGEYIVDFVCFDARLVVELDGGQHAQKRASDRVRDAWLRAHGFRVIRFWNNDVLTNIDGVMEVVFRELVTLSPAPLPSRERGR